MSKYEKTTRGEIRKLIDQLPSDADDDVRLWAVNSANGPDEQKVIADKAMLDRCRAAAGEVADAGNSEESDNGADGVAAGGKGKKRRANVSRQGGSQVDAGTDPPKDS